MMSLQELAKCLHDEKQIVKSEQVIFL